MTLHKLKSTAQAVGVPQSKPDAQRAIEHIGMAQRELTRIETVINDEIAKITQAHAARIEHLRSQVAGLQSGVQTWCEAHREEICGKGKSANLITGEVSWRQRPPSVRINGQDAVIDQLGALGLTQFVRVKHEVNKEAILATPDQVAGIKGIAVSTGVEDFVITPFEIDLEAA